MKTKYSIEKKREYKTELMRKKAEMKYAILFNNYIKKNKATVESMEYKINRKRDAYIKKKEQEYKRSCLNEIRVLEGKPKKEYAKKMKLNLSEFAMKIAQENARLRDTDENGDGQCISCDERKHREELAGGHRFSRMYKHICIDKHNINAQCHPCNFKTGPMGKPEIKEAVNQKYDENLDIKYGKGTAKALHNEYLKWFKGSPQKYDWMIEIPRLIDENEELWKTKKFYAPAMKWRDKREKYLKTNGLI